MRNRRLASFTRLHHWLLNAANAATPPPTPASPTLPPPLPPPAVGDPPRHFLADDVAPPPPQVATESPPRDGAVASPAPADHPSSDSNTPAPAAVTTSSGCSSLLTTSPPAKLSAEALPETVKSDSYRGDKRRKVLQVKEEVAETTKGATEKKEADVVMTCKKTDGKVWNCKRKAKHPYSLCEYHLSLQRDSQQRRQQQKLEASGDAGTKDAKEKNAVAKLPRPSRSCKEDKDGLEFGPWHGKGGGGGGSSGCGTVGE